MTLNDPEWINYDPCYVAGIGRANQNQASIPLGPRLPPQPQHKNPPCPTASVSNTATVDPAARTTHKQPAIV